MAALDVKIEDFLQRMEKCGEEGKVDEAQTLLRQVDVMKAEREALRVSSTAPNPEKRMEVCDTCSAFLVVGDTQKRTDSHLEGKQHTGYDTIRKAYEELKVSFSLPFHSPSLLFPFPLGLLSHLLLLFFFATAPLVEDDSLRFIYYPPLFSSKTKTNPKSKPSVEAFSFTEWG